MCFRNLIAKQSPKFRLAAFAPLRIAVGDTPCHCRRDADNFKLEPIDKLCHFLPRPRLSATMSAPPPSRRKSGDGRSLREHAGGRLGSPSRIAISAEVSTAINSASPRHRGSPGCGPPESGPVRLLHRFVTRAQRSLARSPCACERRARSTRSASGPPLDRRQPSPAVTGQHNLSPASARRTSSVNCRIGDGNPHRPQRLRPAPHAVSAEQPPASRASQSAGSSISRLTGKPRMPLCENT